MRTARLKLAIALVVVGAACAQAMDASAAVNTTFQFTRSSNLSSTLTLFRRDTGTGQVYSRADWRAGSGDTTNECQTSHGWLPGGYYSINMHRDDFGGTKIQGRVWQLSDKACSGGAGTLRTELFIHSEETSTRQQSCGPAGTDQPFCWEGSNDYYSAGCIKVNHWGDLGAVDSNWHNWGGVTGANKLYVA
jgi:hypothetical protein